MLEWEEFIKNVSDYTGVEQNEITETTSVYEDLGMDSLGLFSLGMYLIKIYNVQVSLSSVATIETIGDIYTLLKEANK